MSADPTDLASAPSVSGTGAVFPVPSSLPLSLYVHIPWCVRKCPYCDFNSHVPQVAVEQEAYIDALLRDLDQEMARQPLGEIQSVFIGGGTPSLFDGAAIGRLLEGIARRLTLVADIEITLEANPGTVEVARFVDYRAAGVNRLSIGVQSLDDQRLAALGRIHSAAEALHAYRVARDVGFDNVNLDLMFGLPRQRVADALSDLEQVIALQPEHLSWYQLTLEPNTAFHHKPPPLPDDDSLADIMELGQQRLEAAGYRRYEVSAYAREGRRCTHNVNYWQFGDYLGIGAGAHGKLTATGMRVWRRAKQRHPAAYLAAQGGRIVSTEAEVTGNELALEFLLNALRLSQGVPRGYFVQRTGLDLADLAPALGRAQALGLLDADPTRLCASALGFRFLNDLLGLFQAD